MIYLADALPKACPGCGRVHTEQWAEANEADFLAGASGQCSCGALYQYVPTVLMATAAQANPCGDLTRYLDRSTG